MVVPPSTSLRSVPGGTPRSHHEVPLLAHGENLNQIDRCWRRRRRVDVAAYCSAMTTAPDSAVPSDENGPAPLSFALPGELSEADQERRRKLRRMRGVATSLLVLAAVVFVLTLNQDGWLGFVHAASEAAMVGAIADWFAVTALFRHPLRIPIPHTAIIPRKKAVLGASLQDFVSDNFMREEIIRERVGAADIPLRVGRWLATPEHADRLVAEGSTVASDILGRVKQADVEAVLTEMVIPRLVEEPLSPAAGQLLGEVVAERAHVGAVDLGLSELYRWLELNPERFMDLLRDRAPTWVPEWLVDRATERLHREALKWVEEVRDDPGARARLALDHWLSEFADDLQHDEETMAQAERLKERILRQPKALTTAVRLWDAFRVALVEALRDKDGLLHRRLTEEVIALGHKLQNDEDFRARADRWAVDGAVYAVTNYGSEVAQIISATVDRWDGNETAKRIELHVGRDLQFIRINGTVVGGLVGLVIHTFVVLFG